MISFIWGIFKKKKKKTASSQKADKRPADGHGGIREGVVQRHTLPARR